MTGYSNRKRLVMPSNYPYVFILLAFFSPWATAESDFQQGILWKIERPGLTASYLLGTIHSSDPRLQPLPSAVEGALQKAQSFTMEALMTVEAVAAMAQRMYFTDGRSLDALLSKTLWQKTIEAMGKHGMAEPLIKNMKPWAVVMTLSTPKSYGVPLDLVLYGKAVAQGKPTYGLESIDEQLATFDELTMTDQTGMLQDTLSQVHTFDALFEEMLQAYLKRDLAALVRLANEQGAKGDRALYERVMQRRLTQRNQRMVARMQPRLKEGQAFIAVGALHLPGEQGILQSLQNQGYRLSAVH